MGTIQDDIKLIEQRKGQYIRLGGLGIMDGLKLQKSKRQFHQIMDYDAGTRSLIIRRYRARRHSYVPYHNQYQFYEIINKKEFLQLPEYCR